mmetsp:Transcript_106743/g.281581  ORF Transcript_106743/g.281581 Transcript_106743/m.281581 type:complete len:402 (-) Transcript_106743:437-1642(-)
MPPPIGRQRIPSQACPGRSTTGAWVCCDLATEQAASTACEANSSSGATNTHGSGGTASRAAQRPRPQGPRGAPGRRGTRRPPGAEGDVLPPALALGVGQDAAEAPSGQGRQNEPEVVDGRPAALLPQQQAPDGRPQHRAQQGGLRHVLHLAHEQQRRGEITGGHPRLSVGDVPLGAELPAESVATPDEQEGRGLVRPARGLWKLHRAAPVDDDGGWCAAAGTLPQVREDHLATPGAKDQAVALLHHALRQHAPREALEVWRGLASVERLWVPVVLSPSPAQDLHIQARAVGQLGVDRCIRGRAAARGDDGHQLADLACRLLPRGGHQTGDSVHRPTATVVQHPGAARLLEEQWRGVRLSDQGLLGFQLGNPSAGSSAESLVLAHRLGNLLRRATRGGQPES